MNNLQRTAVSSIRDHLQTAGKALLAAGQEYVRQIDSDPDFREMLQSALPLTSAFLADLESVGRGHLDSRVIELGLTCGSALKRLPLSEQQSAIEKGIEVWTGTGEPRVLPLAECGSHILRQCIGPSSIRTPSEQSAWNEEINAKLRQKREETKARTLANGSTLHYRVDRKKKVLHVLYPPCRLGAKELRAILKEIES